jgi:hypothetical protein
LPAGLFCEEPTYAIGVKQIASLRVFSLNGSASRNEQAILLDPEGQACLPGQALYAVAVEVSAWMGKHFPKGWQAVSTRIHTAKFWQLISSARSVFCKRILNLLVWRRKRPNPSAAGKRSRS